MKQFFHEVIIKTNGSGLYNFTEQTQDFVNKNKEACSTFAKLNKEFTKLSLSISSRANTYKGFRGYVSRHLYPDVFRCIPVYPAAYDGIHLGYIRIHQDTRRIHVGCMHGLGQDWEIANA